MGYESVGQTNREFAMMVARTIGLSKTGRARSSLRCSWVISDRQIINPRGPQG